MATESIERIGTHSHLAHKHKHTHFSHFSLFSLFSLSSFLLLSSSRYRSIAEQATGQVASVRQQSQIERLESIQLSEKERSHFETQVMDRAKQLVYSAKAEAKQTKVRLEQEREKFAKFEVEVRRQFEAHCRHFEGQLRTKALSILTSHNVGSSGGLSSFTPESSVVASTENHDDSSRLGSSSSSSGSSASDQFQPPQRQQQQPNGGSGSPEDERVRKTVR